MTVRRGASQDQSLIKQGILGGLATLLFSVLALLYQQVNQLTEALDGKAGAYDLDRTIEVMWTSREQEEFEKRLDATHEALNEQIRRLYIEIDRLRDGK